MILEYRKDVKGYITNPLSLVREYQCPKTLKNKTQTYTTDFLVDFVDGRRELWEIKASREHALRASSLIDSFQEQASLYADKLLVMAVEDLASQTMIYNLQGLSIYQFGAIDRMKWQREKKRFDGFIRLQDLKLKMREANFPTEGAYQAIWSDLATFDIRNEILNNDTVLEIK